MDRMHFGQHSSSQFNEALESIRNHLMEMGGLVEKQVVDALESLLHADSGLAEKVMHTEEKVDQLEIQIDEECARVLALRQPAASDLRLIIAVSKAVSDLERIGDESAKIAAMALQLSEQGESPRGYVEVRGVTEMSNGNLDAAFFTSGVPNSSITGLMQTNDVTFVPVDGDVADKLLEAYPYYESYTIPADKPERYGLDNAVTTVAIRNILIVPASMDDGVAEELTQRFDDYLQSDKVSVGALKDIDPASMDQNLVVPLHPGAKAYYDGRAGTDDASND
ncbi:phosphate signaling complex protein PhoU [Halomonas sp. N3-2A]|uniref:phosphate signaling complex protein PhoU n=1 Tax=Halomonas sp. N3-2A TaxID=2014541 RepID=UPI000B5B1967|nr:phosphate signaling complex protein PhoU [Halomonas sp. N3-2A]ASK21733.1 phosphate transport system regulatory protein PhoU [Halomonas sp. N3-2A]